MAKNKVPVTEQEYNTHVQQTIDFNKKQLELLNLIKYDDYINEVKVTGNKIRLNETINLVLNKKEYELDAQFQLDELQRDMNDEETSQLLFNELQREQLKWTK